MRRLVVLLVAALWIAAPAVGAQTGTTTVVDRAAEALKASPVFVDPDAEADFSEEDAEALRDRIEGAGLALFIAVLPAAAADEVGGDPRDVVRALEARTGLAGDYAAAIGRTFLAEPSVGEMATAAVTSRRSEGLPAILEQFVDNVSGAGTDADGGAATQREPAATSEEDGASNMGLWAVLGLGGAGLYVWSRRRRRKLEAETARAEAADRQLLQAELSVLADDVMRLEPQVAIHPEAREDYDAAVNRYRAAAAALEYADEPVDLVRVERVVAEARYAMDRTRAVLDGREPPPPPEELRRPGRHDEPPVEVDRQGQVVYSGYDQPFYGGGWFGGGSGLFTGLLLGQMLGGGFGGWGGHVHDEGSYGDPGGDSGGDWGGGDFGGGDFGGGDFGGGDF